MSTRCAASFASFSPSGGARRRYLAAARADGDGMEECEKCKGTGSIVMFVRLTVTFTNHIDNQVLDASGMPADMVRDASGTLICQ